MPSIKSNVRTNDGPMMRMWVTNDGDLCQLLEQDGLDNPVKGTLSQFVSEQKCLRILRWEFSTESLRFDFTTTIEAAKDAETAKRRKIVYISNRIFDPLGFLSPTVLVIKILFQHLRQKYLSWYDLCPYEVQKNFTMKCFNNMLEFHIPRRIAIVPVTLNEILELHVFFDVTESTYGE